MCSLALCQNTLLGRGRGIFLGCFRSISGMLLGGFLSYFWESYWDILGDISGISGIYVGNCANYTVGSKISHDLFPIPGTTQLEFWNN